uniref:N-acetylgalactosaminide beta-1,3-galactosyltransferase n=1 Tax=Albugo laibachii Nc14 TaxID=890382 RepID=F0WI43_9STRA|nr:glycoproteinNacetylgalactosamine 3betagalactosyltransferase putative [Albugo laibachii Nc14]|eukprot:CCA20921.1 glycoproteinNacetylgalactosamine 3betagalactosyltransferase putative [Albugo laibachii Nc14]
MTSSDTKKARILCWVNTHHKNHETRIDPIKRTWGKKCDKILFMSDQEDTVYRTVRVHAPPFHKMSWQKHREAVRTIVREIDEDEFDWIYKCDDDTFVIMENLRRILLSPRIKAIEPTTPLLLGHRMTLQWWELQRPFTPFAAHKREHVEIMMQVDKETRKRGGLYYTPGGGGYVMNWAYLNLLASSLDESYCLPREVIPDDWATSFCMLYHNVSPFDTRDEFGRERFHQYDPEILYHAPHDENAFDHSIRSSIYEEANWFSDHYGFGWKNGSDCCAADSVSFHYIIPPFMDIIYAYYYNT